MVRSAIKDFVSEDKIAQNVNSDEAAVLGAAFYGATQSRQFKTKEFRVIDLTLNGVEVGYNSESGKRIESGLWKSGSKTGGRKTLKVRRGEDFELDFKYSSGPKQYVFHLQTQIILLFYKLTFEMLLRTLSQGREALRRISDRFDGCRRQPHRQQHLSLPVA